MPILLMQSTVLLIHIRNIKMLIYINANYIRPNMSKSEIKFTNEVGPQYFIKIDLERIY